MFVALDVKTNVIQESNGLSSRTHLIGMLVLECAALAEHIARAIRAYLHSKVLRVHSLNTNEKLVGVLKDVESFIT